VPETVALSKFACPACGGEANWNPARQKLVCPFCGTESPAKLDAAGEIEEAVMSQLRVIFKTPEMTAQTYIQLKELIREEEADGRMSGDVAATETEVAQALRSLDGIWDELFPAEKHRIVQLLVEQVTVYENDLDIRIHTTGMHSIISELTKSEEKKCRV